MYRKITVDAMNKALSAARPPGCDCVDPPDACALHVAAPAMARLLLDLREQFEGYYASGMFDSIDEVLRAAGVIP